MLKWEHCNLCTTHFILFEVFPIHNRFFTFKQETNAIIPVPEAVIGLVLRQRSLKSSSDQGIYRQGSSKSYLDGKHDGRTCRTKTTSKVEVLQLALPSIMFSIQICILNFLVYIFLASIMFSIQICILNFLGYIFLGKT